MPKKQTSKTNKFSVKCAKPVDDEIFNIQPFKEFLVGKIKVDGIVGNVKEGGPVSVEQDDANSVVTVVSQIPFSKRYLKYLTKKYLKANGLRDYIRVVADTKSSYELRYYTIQEEAEE